MIGDAEGGRTEIMQILHNAFRIARVAIALVFHWIMTPDRRHQLDHVQAEGDDRKLQVSAKVQHGLKRSQSPISFV